MNPESSRWRLSLPELAFSLGLVAFTASAWFWLPECRAVVQDVTLAELAMDHSLAKPTAVRVEGAVCGMEPFPFGIGDDQENMLLCITDGESSIEAMGDLTDWGFEPGQGERVRAKVILREYGSMTPMLLIRTLEPSP